MTATIMIIDDSLTVRKILEIGLQREDFEVVSFDNGIEALITLRQLAERSEKLPDLILLDIRMPKLDGYQIAQLLKSHSVLKSIPILMLTCLDGVLDRLKGRVAGAAGYITKPFRIEQIITEVHEQLVLQQKKLSPIVNP